MTWASAPLGQDLFDDVSLFHTRQSLIQTLIFKRQLVVVDAKLMQDRCVEVTNVGGILQNVVAVIVGHAIFESTLDSRSGHPQ